MSDPNGKVPQELPKENTCDAGNAEETLFVPPPSFKERLAAAQRARQRPQNVPEEETSNKLATDNISKPHVAG